MQTNCEWACLTRSAPDAVFVFFGTHQEALWGEMKALLLDRYRKLEAALRQCHGDRVRLQPGADELLRMLRAV